VVVWGWSGVLWWSGGGQGFCGGGAPNCSLDVSSTYCHNWKNVPPNWRFEDHCKFHKNITDRIPANYKLND